MSLRQRFILVLAAYGLALAGALGIVSWNLARDALENELDRRLVSVAAGAAFTGFRADLLLLFAPGLEDDIDYLASRARLAQLTEQELVDEAFIFRVDVPRRGLSSAGSGSGSAVPELIVSARADEGIGTELHFLQIYWEDINRAIRDGRATTPLFEGGDGRSYKYGFVQIDNSPALLGVLMPADFLAPVNRLRNTLLLGTVAAVIVAGLLGALLAAGIVRPLEELSRAALRIQRGRLERPVPGLGEDEVGRLARAMERMRAGILERDAQLRLMLAQVAHEVRNPLGGLELFASAAAEADDPNERRRLIQRVRKEVDDLNRIIDDFLTFARPLEAEYREVDLREPIEEASELIRAEMEVRGASLETSLPPYPLLAEADADRVKRAVLNLLRNAMQSGDRVRLWAEAEHGEIMIAVLDDGPGVSRDLRDHVFDPFVTEKEKGAGLGLTIVKKVAEAHGGRVEIREASDDSFGDGAEFRLYLSGAVRPRRAPEPEAAPAG